MACVFLPTVQVVLPSHLAGDSHSDPKIRALSQQLKDIDHKIAHNELDIPPEGQRSPSPEPVYDKMGVRLNTREIRYKEKMLETRHRE
jgi:splicing factor 1